MQGPIVIIGFMGSGKTTVGQALSQQMDMDFIDLDISIVEASGMTIPQYFKANGEGRFRVLESKLFHEAMSKEGCVISCGGGIVLNQENLALLRRRGTVILLRASADTVANRLDDDATRPLLESSDKPTRIREMMDSRKKLYISAADIIIDTDDLSPDEVVQKIVRKLG